MEPTVTDLTELLARAVDRHRRLFDLRNLPWHEQEKALREIEQERLADKALQEGK